MQRPVLILLSGLALFLAARAFAAMQEEVPPAPSVKPLTETYRLRVQNARYGRVEVSTDGGRAYVLVGRVLRAATAPGLDKTARQSGAVLRSSTYGLAFSIAPNEALKLRPRADTLARASAPPETSSIVTNLDVKSGLFGDLIPPPRTPVHLQAGTGETVPLPESYAPGEDDAYVFLVTLPPPPASTGAQTASDEQRLTEWKKTVHKRIEEMGKNYADSAIARARAEKRAVVTGTLTLRAKLPDKEPDPIQIVTYAIDGDFVAAQNTPPFVYAWDTTRVSDGEHTIEIRAHNARGVLLTRARALVVVANKSLK